MEHLQTSLAIEFAQYSSAGIKKENQDSLGARIPEGSLLASKGIAVAIADGVSTSEAARQASQMAVTGFLSDYYATPDTWRTQQCASVVIQSLNRHLWCLGLNSPRQEGLLTTFSSVVLKGNQAFCFHVGDSRIYRMRDGEITQLTRDHSQRIDKKTTYLSRALGADSILEIDMLTEEVEVGDYFILTTDGIHDSLSKSSLLEQLVVSQNDLDGACKAIHEAALANDSKDNLSVQILRVASLGANSQSDVMSVLSRLPFPPPLNIGQTIDGLKVLKIMHESERSQVYLVEDKLGKRCVMKTPSVNYTDDVAYIERFVLESWIGHRIDSPHVVKVVEPPENRSCLYYLTEFIDGVPLGQYIKDKAPLAPKEAVEITEGIVKGLRAFHRKDTLHQDIKPDNVIISEQGPVIIDFGSCWVAGISEMASNIERDHILGTLDYSAPEYRFGAKASARSDQFSAAVILYELLTGKRPYGEAYGKAMHLKAFQKLNYCAAQAFNPHVPHWLDRAISKAVSIHPEQRYSAFSEWLQDIKRPNPKWQSPETQPLLQRNPLRFWQALAAAGWAIALFYIIDGLA